MASLYGVESGNLGELLRRVDVVPVALALAQSAIESGWGTSRFARNGNAVFGQKSWSSHAGLVPLNRDPDKTHVVKSFRDLKAAVLAYAGISTAIPPMQRSATFAPDCGPAENPSTAMPSPPRLTATPRNRTTSATFTR